MTWLDRSFPSAAKIMEGSEKAESMSCDIEFMVRNPASTSFLSGVQDGVGVHMEASSSLTKSRFARVGVCNGVATVDDESQLEPLGENEEWLDEPEGKDDAVEWVFDPNCMFWSANIFIVNSMGWKKGAGRYKI